MSEIEVEVTEPPRRGNTQVSYTIIGGRRYPIKTVSTCRTCRSVHRPEIEQAIILGMTYKRIMDELVDAYDHHSPLGRPDRMSLTAHVQLRHMPTPFSVQRDVIEDQARKLGKNIEEGEALLTDSLTIFRSIVQRGYERMNKGEIEPSMSDLLKAAQLQHVVESAQVKGQDDDDGVEMWREALVEYMTIVQRSVTSEQFQQIGLEMSKSPTLQAISRRRSQIPGQIEG